MHRRLASSLGLAAVLVAAIVAAAPSAFAAPSRAQRALTCSPVDSSHTTALFNMGNIWVVSGANGANVRNAPSTSGTCIIRVAGHNSNVVEVPIGTYINGQPYNEVNANGYTWIRAAYFQGNCRDCSNIDWAHTGWIATLNLRQLNTGYTCIVSPSCSQAVGDPVYAGDGYASKTDAGATPASGFHYCDPNLQPYFTQMGEGASCFYAVSAIIPGPAYNTTDGFPPEYGIGAYDSDPNWFVYASPYETNGGRSATYYWEYDWWAH